MLTYGFQANARIRDWVCASDRMPCLNQNQKTFGFTRGKGYTVDAHRIAEYAYHFNDKAVAYIMEDKTMMLLKNLLQTGIY